MSELIRYESEDGCEHCLHVFLTEDETSPVVLLFPAMGTQSPYYFALANSFNQSGIQFSCTDLRGHGPMHAQASWSNNFGYYELIHFDWPAALKALRNRLPNAPIFLMGHSLGAQISTCFLSLRDPKQIEPEGPAPKISGLIMVASGSVYHKGYAHPMRVLWGTQTLKWLANLFGHMPGKWLGFAGREARGIIRDWSYTAKSGRFRVKHNNKYQNLDGKLSQLQIPILAVTFDGDKLSPHRSMQNLLDKLHLADKRHWKTSARDLKLDKLNHFSWVKQGAILTPKLVEWMRDVLEKQSRKRKQI